MSHATQRPPPPARGRPRLAAMNPDAQAPRSPTRANGAGKREERGSEMSGTRSEPQPTEASTSRQTHGRSPRMRRHRHGHDDITEQASRENGLIMPPRLTTRQAGSKAGRGNICHPRIFRIFSISVSLYLCIFSIHISILDSLCVLSAPCRISSRRIALISCIVYIEIHRFFSRSESS